MPAISRAEEYGIENFVYRARQRGWITTLSSWPANP